MDSYLAWLLLIPISPAFWRAQTLVCLLFLPQGMATEAFACHYLFQLYKAGRESR